MDKETIIGIKYTCPNCNVSKIDLVDTKDHFIKNISYVCACSYAMYREIIHVSSRIISDYDFQRLSDYDGQNGKKREAKKILKEIAEVVSKKRGEKTNVR